MVVTPLEKLRATRAPFMAGFHEKSESFQKLIDSPKVTIRQCKVLLKQLTTKLEKINDITEEIVELLESDEEISLEMKTLDDLRDRMLEFNDVAEGIVSQPSAAEVTSGDLSHVNLPKMNLKIFDGDIFQWQAFWDRFESTIHKNPRLGKIERFNYLDSVLQKEAATVIAGLPITGENYDAAIALLQERYGKPDVVISACMKQLLALPEVKSSSLLALRKLLDSCKVHVRNLSSLGVTTGHFSALLSPVLLSKLPQDIRLIWTRQAKADSNDLNQLLVFLKEELDSRERSQSFERAESEAHQKHTSELKVPKKEPPTISAFSTTTTSFLKNYLYCSDTNHSMFNCPKSTSEKRDFLNKGGRCFNCTRKGQRSNECPTPHSKCKNCKGLHHTTICDRAAKAAPKPESIQPLDTTVLMNLSTNSNEDVLLQTATILIQGKKSNKMIRCLVDGGSQRSFVTQEIAAELELPCTGSEFLRIQPFGTHNANPPKNYQHFDVKVRGNNPGSEMIVIKAVAVPMISATIPKAPYRSLLAEIANEFSPLADFPSERQPPNTIDLLIVADQCWDVLLGNHHRTRWGPVALVSKFGWIIHGPVSFKLFSNAVDTVSMLIRTTADPDVLDEQLITRFWNIDSIGICEPSSPQLEDEALIRNFQRDVVYREPRYSVSLPWKISPNSLDDNLELCDKRLRSLLRKFKTQPRIKEAYLKTITEYREAQFITEVPISSSSNDRTIQPLHYLPHHPVIREDKISSKIRIVFDASAKTPNGTSLNDCLECGPALNPELIEILIAFRTYKIPLVADIEKAFPQILIDEKDRDVLRFLWVLDPSNPNSDLMAYRWNRLIFGMKSSPFLLAAIITHHLKREATQYPETAAILKTSMYVDDVVAGVNTLQEAEQFLTEARELFTRAGMNLRRWLTSKPGLQQRIGDSDAEEVVTFHGTESVNVLGLVWKNLTDTFSFTPPSPLTETKIKGITKRKIISAIAKLFDPLGLVSPVVVAAKLLIQKLWSQGISWDEPVPEPLISEFTTWMKSLHYLDQVSVPRFIHSNLEEPIEIHIFCDASQRAYATVAYVRIPHDGRTILIASKTRVAPLKQMSLPRLELIAALLGARLWAYMEPVFTRRHLTVKPTFWSDSQVTLAWIKSHPGRWRQFVGNRVSEIRTLTPPSYWPFCPGEENPADFASRGVIAEDFIEN